MGGEAHANPGCYCGFILLVCTETALWKPVQLGWAHWTARLPYPPPQQSLEPRVSDVMGSQNAVCWDKHTPSHITVGLYVFSSLHHEHTTPPPLFDPSFTLSQTALWPCFPSRGVSAVTLEIGTIHTCKFDKHYDFPLFFFLMNYL